MDLSSHSPSRLIKRLPTDPASYHVEGFTYMYHSTYGSPITNQETAPVRGVEVAEDGLSARIAVDGLRKGYIHELKLTSMRSEEGDPLLHDVAYYTLNEIPDGPKMTVAAPAKPAKPTAERGRNGGSCPAAQAHDGNASVLGGRARCDDHDWHAARFAV